MRIAASIWDTYKNNGAVQDALETLIGAGVSAGGQALFTDMSAEEIAASTALGAGAAMGARPIGGIAGRHLGKAIDKAAPMPKEYNIFNPMTRDGIAYNARNLREMGTPRRLVKSTIEMSKAKRNQNQINADGSERGWYEGMGALYGRNYADNLAQFAVAAGTPAIMSMAGMGNQQSNDQLGM